MSEEEIPPDHAQMIAFAQKSHQLIQDWLAVETSHQQRLDAIVKHVSRGDDYIYRVLLLYIGITRCYGQVDGIAQLLPAPDFNDITSVATYVQAGIQLKVGEALSHVSAELKDLEKQMEQLKS